MSIFLQLEVLSRVSVFSGSHPAIMRRGFGWGSDTPATVANNPSCPGQ